MNKQNKTKLFFILSAIFFVSIAMAACNSGGSEKTVTKDSLTIIKADTPVKDIKDSGDVKPTPDGN